MPTVTFSDLMSQTGPAVVQSRVRWADAWSTVNLIPTRIGFALLPEPSQAELEWDYGRVFAEPHTALTTQTKQTWLGRYVKIELPTADGTILWIGFVDEVHDTRHGINPAGPTAYGLQRLVASDMAQALRNELILDAYWTNDPFTAVRKLESPIAFNAGGIPNRSPTKLTSGTFASVNSSYVFCDSPADAEFWRSKDMIEYLLAWHSPRKPNGTIGIPFSCDNLSVIPDSEVREITTEGARVMDLIEEILDRRVALTSSIRYNSGANANVLHLHSTTDVSVQGVPANTDLVDLVVWSDPATNLSSSQVASNLIHQVIARGAPRVTIRDTMTLEGWSSADEDAYLEGASLDPDYGPEVFEKLEQNEKVREEEPIRNVFRRLVLDPAMTFLDDTSPTRQAYTPFLGTVGILPHLPIDPAEEYATVTSKLRRAFSDRKPNLAYIQLTYMPNGVAVNDRDPIYQYLQQAFLCEIEYDPEGRWIDVNAIGNYQHQFSKTTGLLDIDTVFPNAIDLEDVKWTLALTDGRRATGVFPASPTDRDQTRRITLDFPSHELVEIMPSTVIGLAVAALDTITTPGGFVIDSRPELSKLAERAANWFSVPRSIISVQSQRITSAIAIGQLIATVDSGTTMAESPKSVVSRVAYTLPRVFNSSAPAASMSFSTFLPQLTTEAFS